MSSNRKDRPKESVEPGAWISQAAAAQMRGISRQAIADLVARGRFQTLEIGGKVLVRRSDVAEFTAMTRALRPRRKNHPKERKRVRGSKTTLPCENHADCPGSSKTLDREHRWNNASCERRGLSG